MRNPWRTAKDRFAPYWPYISMYDKLRAFRLIAGDMFWEWVGNWAHRMQQMVVHEENNRSNK